MAPLPVVWSAADITNALMAIPNLISLLVLTHVIVDETREHLWNAPENRVRPYFPENRA